MSTTNYLGLNIPDKNSKGRVVTDVFEPNFTKIDQNAEVVDIDKNAIWGGEYGGYIQDTSVTKVVGERYIDQFDRKAYECLVPSHENTITNYQACNMVDNLHYTKNIDSMLKASEVVRVYRENWFYVTEFADGGRELFGEYAMNDGPSKENTITLPTWATGDKVRRFDCYLVGVPTANKHVQAATIFNNSLNILYGGSGTGAGAYVRFILEVMK